MTRSGATRLGLISALVVLALDQGSKYWVLNVLDLPDLRQVVLLPVLNLTMVWNQGVTFGLLNGLGSWSHLVLAAVALGVVAALFLWLRRADGALTAIAIGAIAGGAIGNVVDRLRYGAVVDFIHAHIGDLSWYVFNVADAAIVCGVVCLILETRFRQRTGRKRRDADNPVWHARSREGTSSMTNPITGRCFCGAVRFCFDHKPIATRACWCRDCQYLAAGNASVNAIFRAEGFELTGEVGEYVSTADSGSIMRRRFCPKCGTQLFSEAQSRPELIVVRVGALDEREELGPTSFIWTKSRPAWGPIDPSLPNSDGQPAPVTPR